jgi:RNA polymerase sigma-70 factor (ECF subfamily)
MSHNDIRFHAEIWPHAAAVLRAAQFLTRNEAEAEDLAQEVMLKAFHHLAGLRDSHSAKAWLMTILRNTRLDLIRASAKSAGDVSLEDFCGDPPARPTADTEAIWDEPEAMLQEFSDRLVISALRDLPEEIRWTLMLVDVEGLDKASAAVILGVPEGTVGSRTFRGRRMLKERLTPLARQLKMIR